MKKISSIGALFISVFMLFASCENGEVAPDLETETVQLTNDVEKAFSSMDQAAGDAVNYNAQSSSGRYMTSQTSACAEYTFTGNKEIIIDYGTKGCVHNGNTISGQMTLKYTERLINAWSDQGVDLTYEFQDLKVDSLILNGTRMVNMKFTKTDSIITIQNSVNMQGASIEFPDGSSVEYTSNRVHTFTTDFSDIKNPTVEIKMEGSSQGTNRAGVKYTSEITTPLIISSDCYKEGNFIPSSGIKDITPEEKSTRTVDYGDGSCDNSVTVTADGGTIRMNFE